MVFCSSFNTFKGGAILAESGREFKAFGAEQEQDRSYYEVLDRAIVSDDLSVLLHVSAVSLDGLDIYAGIWSVSAL